MLSHWALIEEDWFIDFFRSLGGECATGLTGELSSKSEVLGSLLPPEIIFFLFVCNRGDVTIASHWAPIEEDWYDEFF